MAGQIIFDRFFAFETPLLRITFSFIPTVLMAMILGPTLTATGSALSDFFGIMLFPKNGTYFPGFTISALITGYIYGVFFYKKKISWKSTIIARLLITLIVNLFLNTLWLYMLQGKAVIAFLPSRIIKDLLLFPIQVVIIYVMGNHKELKKQITKFQHS